MEHLWSPWRFRYVSQAAPQEGCLFCVKASESGDAGNFIVLRAELNFIILNLYPYTTGHLMIAPYAHVATLDAAPRPVLEEMIQLTARAERVLREAYQPGGFNIGMNIGACAGAGVAGHLHLHVVPRWPGDANFMTATGETRVSPEDLGTTFEKVRDGFARIGVQAG